MKTSWPILELALPITLMAAQDRLIGFVALIAAKSDVRAGRRSRAEGQLVPRARLIHGAP
jgi:hypothetical protein